MTDISVYPAIVRLDERNAAAQKCIARTAKNHAIVDAVTGGAAGLLGLGAAAAIGQLVYQTKSVYPSMIRELGAIYEASPDRLTTLLSGVASGIEFIGDLAVADLPAEMLGAATLEVIYDFGSEFFLEISSDLTKEVFLGALVGSIPFVGALTGAAFDAALAATMTWRVGSVVSIYFQNGGYVENRKNTYKVAKKQLGVAFSPDTDRRGLVQSIPEKVPEVRQKQLQFLIHQARSLKGNKIDARTVLQILLGQEYPSDLVQAAVRETFA